jgi:kynurenine formamidase
MQRILCLILIASASCAAQRIDDSKLVDLTHAFDASTVYWPTAEDFHWKKTAWGPNAHGKWYAAGEFSTSEHGGTHLDAPIHFAEGRQTAEQIEVARLVGPAYVIDISAQCAKERDYQLQPEDITAFEKKHGKIPAKAIVLVRTGWSRFWPDREKYLGSAQRGDASGLHFPGVSPAAAEVLVARGVDGVGIDTASIDHGPSQEFGAHRVLAAANIYNLENLMALERLPAKGATLIALPMKITGGSGGPVRAVAVLP